MSFNLDKEIQDIRKTTDGALREERLASAFRKTCKSMTWNLRDSFQPGLHPTPTAEVSPVTIHENGRHAFTLTAVKTGDTLDIICGPDHVALRTEYMANAISSDNASGHTPALMANTFQQEVSIWLDRHAPGAPRTP